MTPLPPSLLTPTDLNPSHVLFSQVASLLSPPDNALRRDFLSGWSGDADRLTDRWGRGNESWTTAWGPSVAGWREPEGLNEGELVCMDALYFATERGEEVRNLYEGRPGRGQYGPWSTVGRHLFFARPLKAKAEAIVRTVLSLSARAKLPHFFTMHIRRGDFLEECQPEWPWCVQQNCGCYDPAMLVANRRPFPPFQAYASFSTRRTCERSRSSCRPPASTRQGPGQSSSLLMRRIQRAFRILSFFAFIANYLRRWVPQLPCRDQD